MTESEVFESILGINEIQVDRVEWQDQSLHIVVVHPPVLDSQLTARDKPFTDRVSELSSR
jgi:hypothetical protein